MVECLSVASEQVFGLKVREDFQLLLYLNLNALCVFVSNRVLRLQNSF